MQIETRFNDGQLIYYVIWNGVRAEDRQGYIEQIEIFAGEYIVDEIAIFYVMDGGNPRDRIMQEFCFATPEERDMWWKDVDPFSMALKYQLLSALPKYE